MGRGVFWKGCSNASSLRLYQFYDCLARENSMSCSPLNVGSAGLGYYPSLALICVFASDVGCFRSGFCCSYRSQCARVQEGVMRIRPRTAERNQRETDGGVSELRDRESKWRKVLQEMSFLSWSCIRSEATLRNCELPELWKDVPRGRQVLCRLRTFAQP